MSFNAKHVCWLLVLAIVWQIFFYLTYDSLSSPDTFRYFLFSKSLFNTGVTELSDLAKSNGILITPIALPLLMSLADQFQINIQVLGLVVNIFSYIFLLLGLYFIFNEFFTSKISVLCSSLFSIIPIWYFSLFLTELPFATCILWIFFVTFFKKNQSAQTSYVLLLLSVLATSIRGQTILFIISMLLASYKTPIFKKVLKYSFAPGFIFLIFNYFLTKHLKNICLNCYTTTFNFTLNQFFHPKESLQFDHLLIGLKGVGTYFGGVSLGDYIKDILNNFGTYFHQPTTLLFLLIPFVVTTVLFSFKISENWVRVIKYSYLINILALISIQAPLLVFRRYLVGYLPFFYIFLIFFGGAKKDKKKKYLFLILLLSFFIYLIPYIEPLVTLKSGPSPHRALLLNSKSTLVTKNIKNWVPKNSSIAVFNSIYYSPIVKANTWPVFSSLTWSNADWRSLKINRGVDWVLMEGSSRFADSFWRVRDIEILSKVCLNCSDSHDVSLWLVKMGDIKD